MRSNSNGMDRYRRDQDLMFQQILDAERRSRRFTEVDECVREDAIRIAHFDKISRLWLPLANLGRLAGMSGLDAFDWASKLVQEGKRRWLTSRQAPRAVYRPSPDRLITK